MNESKKSSTVSGDNNVNTAFVLAELHMQNELLFAIANKDAKNKPIPDAESITRLYHFFLEVLKDGANIDSRYHLPLQEYVRRDGTGEDTTLLENLEARDSSTA